VVLLHTHKAKLHVVESGDNRSFALQYECERALYVGWPTGNIPDPSPEAVPFWAVL